MKTAESVNVNPLMIQHPSRVLVCGPTMSGKSSWVKSILERDDAPWKRVILITARVSADQPLWKELRENMKFADGVKTVYGLPSSEDEEREVHALLMAGKGPTAIVVDDQMEEGDKGRGAKFLSKLFTQSRHANASVFNIIQTVMQNRRARQNCEYIWLADFPSCADAVLGLSRQLSPEDKGRKVMRAYRQATQEPYGYLLISTGPGSAQYRYRHSSLDRAFDFSKLSIVD